MWCTLLYRFWRIDVTFKDLKERFCCAISSVRDRYGYRSDLTPAVLIPGLMQLTMWSWSGFAMFYGQTHSWGSGSTGHSWELEIAEIYQETLWNRSGLVANWPCGHADTCVKIQSLYSIWVHLWILSVIQLQPYHAIVIPFFCPSLVFVLRQRQHANSIHVSKPFFSVPFWVLISGLQTDTAPWTVDAPSTLP